LRLAPVRALAPSKSFFCELAETSLGKEEMLNSLMHPIIEIHIVEMGVKVLSRDCDGCERQLFECKRRFAQTAQFI